MQHTFFVHFFAVVSHDYNVKLPETFLWRQCRKCSCSLFLHCCPFSPCIDGPLALSPRLQNFHVDVVPPTKKCLLCVLSLALDLCRRFSRWVSLAHRFFSVFLLLYSPNFLDMTINPSLILLENADTAETISAFFRYSVSSLLTLYLTLLYKTRVAMRSPAKITSSCIWVAILVDWVI